MFFLALAAIVFAALLIKLGALSVIVVILEFTLKCIAAVVVLLAGLFIWKKNGPLRMPWRKQ